MSNPAEGPFVHLHNHTHYSLLDGCAKPARAAQRCVELGMPALAMTDHGNLFGAIDFYRSCKKAGIKPLIGCELYYVNDHKQSERPRRERKRTDDIGDIPEDYIPPKEDFPKYQIHHKGVIAKDFEGYQNLCKLVSDAHVNGVYYKPRADIETLAKYSKGLIGLSGCINGVAAQYLIYGDEENARKATANFVDIFGKENYFIEIQDHGMPVQRRIIPGLLKLAKEFDLKVICANDSHYVYKEDALPHDALLCIQTGKIINDENRMKYPSQEFYLKSRQEMYEIFKEVPESLDNTVHVADMVDLEITFGEDHYPIFECPPELGYKDDHASFDRVLDIYEFEKTKVNKQNGDDTVCKLTPEERAGHKKNGFVLLDLCKQGLKERYGVDYDNRSAYVPKEGQREDFAEFVCQQMDFQLAIITGTGFVDYFLIVWDFINFARSQDIPVGPGRGSGAGCIIAYVLKITDIDPLRFGLLFERMLNLERVSPPDFDIDFCMRRRDVVVNYVRDKYGHDSVANIITFGTFGAKMIVRDLARVNDLQFAEADKLAKMIPDELNISLDDSVEKSADLRNEIQHNPVAKKIVEHGKVIEGMVRNTGKHACGIIIGDQPIHNLVPVTKQEGDLTTQYPKGPSEDLGLLKMDFLGLKTLTVISDAQDNIKQTQNLPDFDIEKVSLEDPKTYDLLNAGNTVGVFQLESGGMQNLCKQIGLSVFEEIIALIALYRPGPMQFIPQFIEGKRDPKKIQIPHPLLKELVSETYGVLVYQEQVMESARIIAGYTLGGADMLRRAMGKKIASVMEAQKQIFVDGAEATHGIKEKEALSIFAILEKFAQYGFNKSHSAAYAMLSYRTAFLKANYPVEFMAALLSAELGNADKVSHFIDEANSMGIRVLSPDINKSNEMFTPVLDAEEGDEHLGSILFGMGAVKGVGDAAAKTIIAEREENGPYEGLDELLERVDTKSVNRRVLECLIKTGAFDFTGEPRGCLFDRLEGAMSQAAEQQRDREAGQNSFFDMLAEEPAPAKGGSDRPAVKQWDPRKQFTKPEMLQYEKELLGFYVSGHPLDEYKGLAEALTNFDLEKVDELGDKVEFQACGVAGGVVKKLSRRDNRPWAFFNLGTRKTSLTVNCYADAFEEYGHNLENDALIVIKGTVIRRDGEVRLNVLEVHPLPSFLPGQIKHITWVLDPDKDTDDFLYKFRAALDNSRGSTGNSIAFRITDSCITSGQTAKSLSWRVNTKEWSELRKNPAVVGCIVETEPVKVKQRERRWAPKAS
ncbi:DNA polymerase III subunit alpha [Pelagicoccus mobilis]|uniref:DNA polymerase III subunit alpha n=1 Tax=Pelagicoccus mobilis TaxID=415221 RepID=A0A934RWH4_9BACT|nr:DNA polymerase III subunit alpha [Pelagicoccus mobilis]MBK1878087.1 DNA polymerase III subunit alpha [Pelagicoccus mobilis]